MIGLSKKEKSINNLLNRGMCSPARQKKIGKEIVKILNSSTEEVSFDCAHAITEMALAFDPSPAIDFILHLMTSPYFTVYKNAFMYVRPECRRVVRPEWRELAKKYSAGIVNVIDFWENPNKFCVTNKWKKLIYEAESV